MKFEKPINLTGTVVHGAALGRKMNMPTINIVPRESIEGIAFGVYYSTTTVNGKCYKSISNIGTKPTVKDDLKINVETFLYDFDDDIYDCEVEIRLLEFKRPEMKFPSVEALMAQLKEDFEAGEKYLEK